MSLLGCHTSNTQAIASTIAFCLTHSTPFSLHWMTKITFPLIPVQLMHRCSRVRVGMIMVTNNMALPCSKYADRMPFTCSSTIYNSLERMHHTIFGGNHPDCEVPQISQIRPSEVFIYFIAFVILKVSPISAYRSNHLFYFYSNLRSIQLFIKRSSISAS